MYITVKDCFIITYNHIYYEHLENNEDSKHTQDHAVIGKVD